MLTDEASKKILKTGALLILLYWGLHNIAFIKNAVVFVIKLLSPFLLGCAIAFALNVPMRFIEAKMFAKAGAKADKIKRPLSLIFTLLLLSGIIFIVIFMISPQISATAETIGERLPAFASEIQSVTNSLSVRIPVISDLIGDVSIDWEKLAGTVIGMINNASGDILGSAIDIAAGIFSGAFTFVVGIVFAIYILLQKERLARQATYVMYAWLPKQRADRMLEIASLAQKTFSGFISGQCLEAVILGTMFFISMSVLRFPYALMISMVIAVTALIPIFGALIGCILGAVLIVIANPLQALWFIVLFLVLQQIEGNFIYPKVVGHSIGLPAIWVLLAVSIGGSLFGVAGMLLFIPLTSVIYSLFRESSEKRIKERGITL